MDGRTDSHSDYSADPMVVQDYSKDPMVVQDFNTDLGSRKTLIMILVQTQGSCNIVQTQGSCNFNLTNTG